MKNVFLALTLLTSFQALAAGTTITCKPTNPDETIYNIKQLKVEVKSGTQKYLIREDKISETSYRTYLEQLADKNWSLNKYEVIDIGREDVLAQIDMVCTFN